MSTFATAKPARRRRRLASVAAPLAALALLAACTDDEPTPGASSVTTPPTEASELITDPAEAAGIPLDGAGESPVKWRETDVDADAAAVLAVRRYVALQYTVLGTADPAELRRLYGTVTGGELGEIHADPSGSTRAPEQLSKGPLFAWVMAAEPQSDGSVAVSVCRDFGWSGDGAAPTARTRPPALTRFVVAGDGSAWRVTEEGDPAPSDPNHQPCLDWAAAHPTPNSPA